MKKSIVLRSSVIIMSAVCAVALAVAVWANSYITTLSENKHFVGRTTIVIDAGHGGEDGGAVSCTGISESKLNLQIAIRLEDTLNLLGYRTDMIRRKDVSVYTEGDTIARRKMSDLKNRVAMIGAAESPLLISIHQNNFSDSRYSGAQVFYAQTTGSEELAKSLQASLVSSLNPGSNRKAKQIDGVYLMEHISCPGILVECGFLSNPTEEARLRSSEYQKALCCVIATTISEHLDRTGLN